MRLPAQLTVSLLCLSLSLSNPRVWTVVAYCDNVCRREF